MDSAAGPPRKRPTVRHKCSACYKEFNKKEHLVEHMKISYHSVHQPRCGVCQKHCKSFESLREHLKGPLAKRQCSEIFSERGCSMCMKVFDSTTTLDKHGGLCRLSPVSASLEPKVLHGTEPPSGNSQLIDGKCGCNGSEAVAIDCEMVGGGTDGSVDLCARVCLVDEDENVIIHTYVHPQVAVTDYRSDVTGITEDHLRDAMPLKDVQEKILKILYNREAVGKVMSDSGTAKILVGHDVMHDLGSLRMTYPERLLRDTAKYRPLMKTNLVSHTLKYLSKAYLGYDIQTGTHDPYEDSVSAMRLYKRMRAQDHKVVVTLKQNINDNVDLESYEMEELEKMSPDELYEISKSDYRCWCQDSRPDPANAA